MKKTLVTALALLLVFAIVFVMACPCYTVAEDEFACVIRLSKIVSTTDQPGLHWRIPFLDRVSTFPKETQIYDIPPSEVLTSDKQNMTADCYVLWRIEDPKKYYQTLGTVSVAQERLNAITYNELKNIMGTLAQSDIINMDDGAERNAIYENITERVSAQAQTYGITVEDVKIKRFDLPASNEVAVYTRMISERNQIAQKYTADGNYEASIIRNDVDKQYNILISNAKAKASQLEAEGEAEYMRMLAEAFDSDDKKDFYEFIIALDALKASLKGSDKTVILDGDSPLAQILVGN